MTAAEMIADVRARTLSMKGKGMVAKAEIAEAVIVGLVGIVTRQAGTIESMQQRIDELEAREV